MAPESTQAQKFSLVALTALRRRLDDRGRHCFVAVHICLRHPAARSDHRLGHRGRRNVHAGPSQARAERKPDLDAGVYAYARAGSGDYPGLAFVTSLPHAAR